MRTSCTTPNIPLPPFSKGGSRGDFLKVVNEGMANEADCMREDDAF
jgi:hypothetical protein